MRFVLKLEPFVYADYMHASHKPKEGDNVINVLGFPRFNKEALEKAIWKNFLKHPEMKATIVNFFGWSYWNHKLSFKSEAFKKKFYSEAYKVIEDPVTSEKQLM